MVSQPYADNIVGIILKRGLLTFIVVLFFCDIAIYLSLAVSARLQPQYWIGLLVVLGGVLAWVSPRTRWEALRTPVFYWCVLFLALTLVFFVAIPTSHVEQLKERIRDVVLLTAFLGVFLMLPGELGFVRKLLVVAVVVGVVINLISLFHIGFLPPPDTKWAHRPNGFYSSPNEAAIALIFGMLISIEVLPQRWRAPYAVFVLAGAGGTFSREALLGWLVVVICLCAFDIIRWKTAVVYFVALMICAIAVTLIVTKAHVMSTPLLDYYQSQIERYYLIFAGLAHDQSAADRWQVLKLGWALFLEHPLIGNGIGVTYHWSLPISTHNMYLLYMDDYGIIGLFLYPLLIWCMIRKAAGQTRKLAWTMAIFLLFWGLFDHNIVQNYYSLFAISLTAAMTRISVAESARQQVRISAEAGSG